MSNNEQTINNLKNITENDKIILKQINNTGNLSLYSELSFYSKKNQIYNLDNYSYIKTDENEDIYCLTSSSGGFSNIYFDSDKKLIFYTRWWYNDFNTFLNHMFHFLNNISNIQLSDCCDIGSNIITIQTWFATYGHFLDEVYNLYDFYNKIINIDNVEYKFLHWYPTEEYYKNYDIISDMLFKSNYINSFKYSHVKLLKMSNLKIIKHSITMDTFHAFPNNVTKYILNNINLNEKLNKNHVFITRGIASHLNRNLSNQKEIEAFFNNYSNFIVINPELITFNEFINNIKNTKIIVTTWGSSLTNLVFLQLNTTVIILKSESYKHESILLFDKIIKNNKLNVIIIESNDNKIEIEKIYKIINKLT